MATSTINYNMRQVPTKFHTYTQKCSTHMQLFQILRSFYALTVYSTSFGNSSP